MRYLRNRKFFINVILAFICFGILYKILTLPEPRRLLTSKTTRDTLNSGSVINDVSIMRCWSLHNNCRPPETYKKLTPPLNFMSLKFSFYNYFLVVLEGFIEVEANKQYLGDVKIQPDKPSNEYVMETKYGLSIWKKFVDPATQPLVREIDVLYGRNDLKDSREHWEFQETPIPYLYEDYNTHLSFLKVSKNQESEIIRHLEEFQKNKDNNVILTSKNRFKILQLSDLHFGQDEGKCYEECKSDIKTINFVRNSISDENIDLVVIAGDLIDFTRVKDLKSALLKALQPILEKKVPFVFTFGESDIDEFANRNFHNDKKEFLSIISSLDYSYNSFPVAELTGLHGLTNYNLKLFQIPKDTDVSVTNLKDPKAFITILDSEEHRLDSSQINYLYRINQNDGEFLKIFKMIFFHYPLPNYRPLGKFKLVGSYNEKHPLNNKTSKKFRDDFLNCGYHVASVGHEHENDACLISTSDEGEKNMWLCYSSVTGDSAETRLSPDFDRRSRIFEVNFDDASLLSWKRKESSTLGYDYQRILHFN